MSDNDKELHWNPQERYEKHWNDDREYPQVRIDHLIGLEKGDIVTMPISGDTYSVGKDGQWIKL
jgi:hypothetical protein